MVEPLGFPALAGEPARLTATLEEEDKTVWRESARFGLNLSDRPCGVIRRENHSAPLVAWTPHRDPLRTWLRYRSLAPPLPVKSRGWADLKVSNRSAKLLPAGKSNKDLILSYSLSEIGRPVEIHVLQVIDSGESEANGELHQGYALVVVSPTLHPNH
jgi:hypothetical protein